MESESESEDFSFLLRKGQKRSRRIDSDNQSQSTATPTLEMDQSNLLDQETEWNEYPPTSALSSSTTQNPIPQIPDLHNPVPQIHTPVTSIPLQSSDNKSRGNENSLDNEREVCNSQIVSDRSAGSFYKPSEKRMTLPEIATPTLEEKTTPLFIPNSPLPISIPLFDRVKVRNEIGKLEADWSDDGIQSDPNDSERTISAYSDSGEGVRGEGGEAVRPKAFARKTGKKAAGAAGCRSNQRGGARTGNRRVQAKKLVAKSKVAVNRRKTRSSLSRGAVRPILSGRSQRHMIRRSQAVETSDSSDCDSGRGVRVVRRSRRSTRGNWLYRDGIDPEAMFTSCGTEAAKHDAQETAPSLLARTTVRKAPPLSQPTGDLLAAVLSDIPDVDIYPLKITTSKKKDATKSFKAGGEDRTSAPSPGNGDGCTPSIRKASLRETVERKRQRILSSSSVSPSLLSPDFIPHPPSLGGDTLAREKTKRPRRSLSDKPHPSLEEHLLPSSGSDRQSTDCLLPSANARRDEISVGGTNHNNDRSKAISTTGVPTSRQRRNPKADYCERRDIVTDTGGRVSEDAAPLLLQSFASKHRRVLMSWEEDLRRGCLATKGPVLFAVENMGARLKGIKGPWINKAKLIWRTWKKKPTKLRAAFTERAKKNRKDLLASEHRKHTGSQVSVPEFPNLGSSSSRISDAHTTSHDAKSVYFSTPQLPGATVGMATTEDLHKTVDKEIENLEETLATSLTAFNPQSSGNFNPLQTPSPSRNFSLASIQLVCLPANTGFAGYSAIPVSIATPLSMATTTHLKTATIKATNNQQTPSKLSNQKPESKSSPILQTTGEATPLLLQATPTSGHTHQQQQLQQIRGGNTVEDVLNMQYFDLPPSSSSSTFHLLTAGEPVLLSQTPNQAILPPSLPPSLPPYLLESQEKARTVQQKTGLSGSNISASFHQPTGLTGSSKPVLLDQQASDILGAPISIEKVCASVKNENFDQVSSCRNKKAISSTEELQFPPSNPLSFVTPVTPVLPAVSHSASGIQMYSDLPANAPTFQLPIFPKHTSNLRYDTPPPHFSSGAAATAVCPSTESVGGSRHCSVSSTTATRSSPNSGHLYTSAADVESNAHSATATRPTTANSGHLYISATSNVESNAHSATATRYSVIDASLHSSASNVGSVSVATVARSCHRTVATSEESSNSVARSYSSPGAIASLYGSVPASVYSDSGSVVIPSLYGYTTTLNQPLSSHIAAGDGGQRMFNNSTIPITFNQSTTPSVLSNTGASTIPSLYNSAASTIASNASGTLYSNTGSTISNPYNSAATIASNASGTLYSNTGSTISNPYNSAATIASNTSATLYSNIGASMPTLYNSAATIASNASATLYSNTGATISNPYNSAATIASNARSANVTHVYNSAASTVSDLYTNSAGAAISSRAPGIIGRYDQDSGEQLPHNDGRCFVITPGTPLSLPSFHIPLFTSTDDEDKDLNLFSPVSNSNAAASSNLYANTSTTSKVSVHDFKSVSAKCSSFPFVQPNTKSGSMPASGVSSGQSDRSVSTGIGQAHLKYSHPVFIPSLSGSFAASLPGNPDQSSRGNNSPQTNIYSTSFPGNLDQLARSNITKAQTANVTNSSMHMMQSSASLQPSESVSTAANPDPSGPHSSVLQTLLVLQHALKMDEVSVSKSPLESRDSLGGIASHNVSSTPHSTTTFENPFPVCTIPALPAVSSSSTPKAVFNSSTSNPLLSALPVSLASAYTPPKQIPALSHSLITPGGMEGSRSCSLYFQSSSIAGPSSTGVVVRPDSLALGGNSETLQTDSERIGVGNVRASSNKESVNEATRKGDKSHKDFYVQRFTSESDKEGVVSGGDNKEKRMKYSEDNAKFSSHSGTEPLAKNFDKRDADYDDNDGGRHSECSSGRGSPVLPGATRGRRGKGVRKVITVHHKPALAQCIDAGGVSTAAVPIPSLLHTSTPSHPHSSTSLQPHTSTPSQPHTLTSPITSSLPHTLTASLSAKRPLDDKTFAHTVSVTSSYSNSEENRPLSAVSVCTGERRDIDSSLTSLEPAKFTKLVLQDFKTGLTGFTNTEKPVENDLQGTLERASEVSASKECSAGLSPSQSNSPIKAKGTRRSPRKSLKRSEISPSPSFTPPKSVSSPITSSRVQMTSPLPAQSYHTRILPLSGVGLPVKTSNQQQAFQTETTTVNSEKTHQRDKSLQSPSVVIKSQSTLQLQSPANIARSDPLPTEGTRENITKAASTMETIAQSSSTILQREISVPNPPSRTGETRQTSFARDHDGERVTERNKEINSQASSTVKLRERISTTSASSEAAKTRQTSMSSTHSEAGRTRQTSMSTAHSEAGRTRQTSYSRTEDEARVTERTKELIKIAKRKLMEDLQSSDVSKLLKRKKASKLKLVPDGKASKTHGKIKRKESRKKTSQALTPVTSPREGERGKERVRKVKGEGGTSVSCDGMLISPCSSGVTSPHSILMSPPLIGANPAAFSLVSPFAGSFYSGYYHSAFPEAKSQSDSGSVQSRSDSNARQGWSDSTVKSKPRPLSLQSLATKPHPLMTTPAESQVYSSLTPQTPGLTPQTPSPVNPFSTAVNSPRNYNSAIPGSHSRTISESTSSNATMSPSVASGNSHMTNDSNTSFAAFLDGLHLSRRELEQLYLRNLACLENQMQFVKALEDQLRKTYAESIHNTHLQPERIELYQRFLDFIIEPEVECNTGGLDLCGGRGKEGGGGGGGGSGEGERFSDVVTSGRFDRPVLNAAHDFYASF